MYSLCLLAFLASHDAAPLQLHPENPHYLLFRGKPTILVTSGEHYGAVLNLDFDFKPYLDTLASHGFNQTRTFSGTYREVPGSFKIQNNTLAPKPDRYLAPWVKVSNASDGQPERFDLDRFEPAYFDRLKAFLTAASTRGIVVELVLFCPLYEEVLWSVNPMNARNNINGVGDCPREEVYTHKHPALLERQLAFTRQVVTELNPFDNLYYEICNEPYFGGVTLDWQARIATEIADTERKLPRKHLIAQNIANQKARVDQPVHPEVDILNFHYAEPAAALENLRLNLALGDDETGFDGNDDRPYRTEAWHFLLSGGSIFSNLDYSYTPDAEDGSAPVQAPTPGGGGHSLRKQLATLKHFIETYDFLRMRPEPGCVITSSPEGSRTSALVEPGHQYAVYLSGKAQGATSITLDLPAGAYAMAWLIPRTGELAGMSGFDHPGGPKTLSGPPLVEDLALKLLGSPPPTPTTCTPRLQVSPNRRFLQYADGSPFFYLADTAWELFHRTDREEADLYLRDRAAKGFNVIQAVVLAEVDGLNAPNSYGHTPLLDNDPTRPSEAYFQHVDFIVNRAAELGLFIGMLPTWGDKVNKKWGRGPVIFTPDNAHAYGFFLGRRYRDKPIIWILGGDRPVENETQKRIWEQMATGLREGDGGAHLFTYHPVGGQSSSDYFPDAPWLDFHMLQSGHSRRNLPNYDQITRLYRHEPIKPCLDGEPNYENHPIGWEPSKGWFDEYDVRKALYWSVFAGACGVTYGCHDIWQMFQPGRDPISAARTPWKESLHQPASSQAQHLRHLVESRPYFDRIPDQNLIAGDPGSDAKHLRATRAIDGSYAFLYIPSQQPVKVDLDRLAGTMLKVWWFNPRDGKATLAGEQPRQGTHTFQPPPDGPDWVLVLDDASRGFPAPGTKP